MQLIERSLFVLLCAISANCILVHSPPTTKNATNTKTNETVQFSGWKPLVKPEALTTTEFVEKLEVAKVGAGVKNATDLEAEDSKRSFILVYPPRGEATEQDTKQEDPHPPSSARSHQGPPLRSYPTQSRYHRTSNFGTVPEGVSRQNKKVPAVFQRPKFPPVANPPPLPDHALRNRQRIPPNFTPESTSQHQVQIQLLDGYIVPPGNRGGAPDIHGQKKTPQITTFPLNLNNVPEIRLLLPGDVHQQLNNLRPQQQNRHSGAYVANQNSDGRNGNPQRDFQPGVDKNNIYSFESQRHPGRTLEYSHTNNNAGNNNQFSARDPAVYPEAVNFPGQNAINNNAVSHNQHNQHNQDKPHNGDVSASVEHSNRGRYPDGSRSEVPHTRTQDVSSNGQNFPQNYGGQLNPATDNNRGPDSSVKTFVGNNRINFPQNYAGGQNFGGDNRGSVPHTKTRDSTNDQGFPSGYGGGQSLGTNNGGPVSQINHANSGHGYPSNNGQGFPSVYGGGQNLGANNGGPVSQTKINDVNSGQGFPSNYGSGQNFGTNVGPISQTNIQDATQGQGFPLSYGNGQNFGTESRDPASRVKTAGQGSPQSHAGQPSVANSNRGFISPTKTNHAADGQGFPVTYGAGQGSTNDRTPVNQVKIDDSSSVTNYGALNPTFDNRPQTNSRPLSTTNSQGVPQNFEQQKLEPDDIQSGQVQIDPYQGGTRDFESRFRPLPTDDRNYNTQGGNGFQSPQTYNSDISGGKINLNRNNQNGGNGGNGFQSPQTYNSDISGGKINLNRNNQNGWRGAPANRGNQNYNPVGIPSVKTNFPSGNAGNNQNVKTRNGQTNGHSNGPNTYYFGTGTDRQTFNRSGPNHPKAQGGGVLNPSSGHDGSGRPLNVNGNIPSVTDRDLRNRPAHDKSHGSNISPSSSDRSRPTHDKSHGSNISPSSSDRSRPTHDKSHGSNISPSSSGRIIAEEDEIVNKPEPEVKSPDSRDSTDDIYFVPPVLSQGEEQIQIDPFGSSLDTTVGSARGGSAVVDHAGFVSVDTGSSTETRFGKQSSCDCSQNCAPIQRSSGENLGSTIREIARSLDADAFFDFVGLTDSEIENMLASGGSYTLFVPSNEAVSRLPSNLIDHWRQNNPDLKQALLNHVVRDRITLDQLRLGGRMTTRAKDATVFINNYNGEAVTVNGHRIVQGDVSAPRDGTIHVIDGTLCPIADQDIISTLRACNKYDGFLTLADVTKLMQTMQNDGPYTVFLPSNEALTKIPPEELAILKENSTVLREFLEYHIVEGAYFSGDLKDGQYLTTLHQRQPVRMGVRVDGCYRRLAEVNNSPLFKADIPTKNGVIHVVDWILRPSDLQWCEGVILP